VVIAADWQAIAGELDAGGCARRHALGLVFHDA
jgi:hypothetical protein